MYKGVNASDGIGIGVARVAVEPDLSYVPATHQDTDEEEKAPSVAIWIDAPVRMPFT